MFEFYSRQAGNGANYNLFIPLNSTSPAGCAPYLLQLLLIYLHLYDDNISFSTQEPSKHSKRSHFPIRPRLPLCPYPSPVNQRPVPRWTAPEQQKRGHPNKTPGFRPHLPLLPACSPINFLDAVFEDDAEDLDTVESQSTGLREGDTRREVGEEVYEAGEEECYENLQIPCNQAFL